MVLSAEDPVYMEAVARHESFVMLNGMTRHSSASQDMTTNSYEKRHMRKTLET